MYRNPRMQLSCRIKGLCVAGNESRAQQDVPLPHHKSSKISRSLEQVQLLFCLLYQTLCPDSTPRWQETACSFKKLALKMLSHVIGHPLPPADIECADIRHQQRTTAGSGIPCSAWAADFRPHLPNRSSHRQIHLSAVGQAESRI